MIIEIQAIWINKNGFGIFLKPVLVSFTPIEIKKYKFLDDSEDEVDDVLDSENCVFIASNQGNSQNELETSNLRIVNDSLDVDTAGKFSSTSSSNKEFSSTPSSSSEENTGEKVNVNI